MCGCISFEIIVINNYVVYFTLEFLLFKLLHAKFQLFFHSFYLIIRVFEENRVHVEYRFLSLFFLFVDFLFLANITIQIALNRCQLLSLVKGSFHMNRKILDSWFSRTFLTILHKPYSRESLFCGQVFPIILSRHILIHVISLFFFTFLGAVI